MPHRYRVYVTRRIPNQALDELSRHADVSLWDEESTPVPQDLLAEQLQAADGVLTMLTDCITAEVLENARCRVISNMSTGFENINLTACTERGIQVTNAPVTESIADLTWALMLAVARRLPEAHRSVFDGRWRTWSPEFMIGRDIHNATLGIIGMGRIGLAVARRAVGFNMHVIYYNRNPHPEAASVGAVYMKMEQVLEQADFVVLLVPLSQETYHMIGARELAMMKPTAILINTGRGALVDEHALLQALREKWIWGAGLDVMEVEPADPFHPLLQLDNVLAVPHIGSASQADRVQMGMLAVTNLLAALNGQKPPNLVNWQVWPKLVAQRSALPPPRDT